MRCLRSDPDKNRIFASRERALARLAAHERFVKSCYSSNVAEAQRYIDELSATNNIAPDAKLLQHAVERRCTCHMSSSTQNSQ